MRDYIDDSVGIRALQRTFTQIIKRNNREYRHPMLEHGTAENDAAVALPAVST
jgi:hypothetical protein